jgi:hypothetical protein
MNDNSLTPWTSMSDCGLCHRSSQFPFSSDAWTVGDMGMGLILYGPEIGVGVRISNDSTALDSFSSMAFANSLSVAMDPLFLAT